MDALTAFLARSPDIDPYSQTLNLGATLKPRPRPALPAGMTPSDTLARDAEAPMGAREPGELVPHEPAGYDILGELGRGGMGIVYRARQRTLRREVAVKRLQSDDAFLRQLFVTESMVTGELEHPNIVPVYALCDEADTGLWLVMKRIGGRTLAQLIADVQEPRDVRAIDRLIDVVLDVADALRFAHSRGVPHRDIKPVNIMVGSFGEVMLLDWGIAASFGASPTRGLNIRTLRVGPCCYSPSRGGMLTARKPCWCSRCPAIHWTARCMQSRLLVWLRSCCLS